MGTSRRGDGLLLLDLCEKAMEMFVQGEGGEEWKGELGQRKRERVALPAPVKGSNKVLEKE